jgi:hypothetical protein
MEKSKSAISIEYLVGNYQENDYQIMSMKPLLSQDDSVFSLNLVGQ